MSWLFKSLQSNLPQSPQLYTAVTPSSSPERSPSADRHGGSALKDDISVLLRGVANFLAPPPSSSSAGGSVESLSLSPKTFDGMRNDLVEIGGTFKSSLSLLSSNKVVTGISEFASQLLQLEGRVVEDDQEEGCPSDGVPGTTDEVVRFVKEISLRPECWTEFPLPHHNADFNMSNSQREHALTIEGLVPEFVALRLNICSYMNVEKFWMIYFLLLLPRLNQHDFERLSTPKIVEARDVLLQKLGEKRNLQVEDCQKLRTPNREDSVTQRENILSEENQISTDITNAAKGLEIDDTVSTENWLEDTDIDTASLTSRTKLEQEEDVPFSDLEDDGSDLSDRLSGHRATQDIRGSSPDGSSDWVQLNENTERGGSQQKVVHLKGKESEDESNDWLAVDDFN